MAEIDIITNHDSYVRSVSPDSNSGTSFGMVIWRSGAHKWIPILRFPTNGISAGATIDLATLYLYANVSSNATTNPIYKNDATFDELTVTWNNMPSPDGASIGNISSNSVGWHTMDITDIFSDWYNGIINNYGIQIWPQSPLLWDGNASYSTKENPDVPSEKPYIKVDYTVEEVRPLWLGPHNNLQII